MIARVVTTAGPLWESELVDRSRYTGLLRIVGRASHPSQVQRALSERAARAVIVGAEIPWLSRRLVGAWRLRGAMVIGVNSPCRPSHGRLLEDRGCEVVLEAADPEWVAAALRARAPTPDLPDDPPPYPTVVAVGGPHGAPGRTEVALGLARIASRKGSCLLIEADPSPALGLRLGLSPPDRPYEPVPSGEIDVLLWRADGSRTGMLRSGWSMLWDYRTTVVDAGPGRDAFREWPGQKVVVCRATPSGIVRAAHFLSRPDPGHPPLLVVNRLEADQNVDRAIMRHLAAWAGRMPDATVGELDDLRWGRPPPRSLLDALKPLADRLRPTDEPSSGDPVAPQHSQIAHGNEVRVEHFGQTFGARGVDQVDEEPVPPGFGGGTRLYPGEVGAPSG